MKEFFKTIIIAALLSLLILKFIQPTMVQGDSMYPNYQNNDYLFVDKYHSEASDFKHGDLIVFKLENKNLIKRVIGLPGDKITIKNNHVYLNGKKLDEPYLDDIATEADHETYKVPEGKLFAMGDNREISYDCRFDSVGYVGPDQIVGKPFVRLFPIERAGKCE